MRIGFGLFAIAHAGRRYAFFLQQLAHSAVCYDNGRWVVHQHLLHLLDVEVVLVFVC